MSIPLCLIQSMIHTIGYRILTMMTFRKQTLPLRMLMKSAEWPIFHFHIIANVGDFHYEYVALCCCFLGWVTSLTSGSGFCSNKKGKVSQHYVSTKRHL